MLSSTHRATASLGFAAAVTLCTAASAQTVNSGVSVSSAGDFGTGFSYYSQISEDGRYVVFKSDSGNLVIGDGNGRNDVFRHDLQTGVTELISVDISGTSSANGQGLSPDVSGDGRYCVFQTDANNVVTGDTNGTWDVFLRDMQTGVTERLSLTSTGAQANNRSDGPRITPSAQYVVFESDAALDPGDTNGEKDVYRLDRSSGQLDLVSVTAAGVQGNNWSYHGDISDDGRYVAFTTTADNLVSPDTNGQLEMLVKDMTTGSLTRLTVSSLGAQANGTSSWPYISGDGSTVVFSSRASNLVPGDTNSNYDLFAVTVATGAVERLNVRPDGIQADDYTRSPVTVSTDGSLVVFASLATDLVPGDTNDRQDIFLRNRSTGTTSRVNLGIAGAELNDDSWVPAMTPDGRILTYTSEATNIVVGDIQNERQIFARDLEAAGNVGTEYCTAVANSTGAVGVLRATGSAVLAQNNLRLEVNDLPTSAFGYFLVSSTRGFTSNTPNSVGNLCLSGSIGRYIGLGEIQNSGATGAFGLDLNVAFVPQPTGFVPTSVGETWNFQAWHRDNVLGGLTSNFTQGLSITLR